MFSVASLLNPVKMDQEFISSPPLISTHQECKLPSSSSSSTLIRKQNIRKSENLIPKHRIKGNVNYPPHEEMDDLMAQEIMRFQVIPLGKISESPCHIPYNSGKKSFLEKTGRESFEVFQYVFKVPWSDNNYTVMWDYVTGLVRITPFFKCYNYSKTTPAKMLAHNPGLKEITHSITGGALVAQGYWMPFNCAYDICATFCQQISPALIPIFGPSFPSACIPPEAPEYARMIISPNTIANAKIQTEASRLNLNIICAKNETTSPPSETCHFRKIYNPLKDSNINYKLLREQHVNPCLTDADKSPPFDVYLSSVSPNMDQKRAIDAVYILTQLDYLKSKTSRALTPKNTQQTHYDVSNLHVMPDINLWHPVRTIKCPPSSQGAVASIDKEGSYLTRQFSKESTNTRNTATSEIKMQNYEIESDLNCYSEETKAAYSLISLSLMYPKVKH